MPGTTGNHDGHTSPGGRPPRETQPMGAYFQTEPHFQQPAVTASFSNPDAAQRSAHALQQAGFEAVQVDRVGPYPVERGEMTDQPFPQSLTGQESIDQRVLSAVDTSISGLSGQPAGQEVYLLTFVLPGRPGAREQALDILREHGARVGIERDRPAGDRYDPQHADDAHGTD